MGSAEEVARVANRRRAEAGERAGSGSARARILLAPEPYVITSTPSDLARHAALCDPLPMGDTCRVSVVDLLTPGQWRVEFAAADRVGLLAREAAVLTDAGYDVIDAVTATWDDGAAVASFRVRVPDATGDGPRADDLERALSARFASGLDVEPIGVMELSFVDVVDGVPRTACRIEAEDRPGLLRAVCAAFAAAGVAVHLARVTTVGGRAVDTFMVTQADGRTVGRTAQAEIARHLADGVHLPAA